MNPLERKIRKLVEKAVRHYRMIQPGDKILVGVSGGPDSLLLCRLFRDGFLGSIISHTFVAVHIDLGFPEASLPNREKLAALFREWDVPFQIIRTEIARSALDPAAKKNPCFICSLYRRKEIYQAAHRLGCNRIAYAHHKDDVIETLLLNILYGRQIGSMNPVQPVFGGKRSIIRPFVYVDEWMLKALAAESGLPVLPRLCPMDGRSRREKIKRIIRELQAEEKTANIRENIFRSHFHVKIDFSPPRV